MHLVPVKALNILTKTTATKPFKKWFVDVLATSTHLVKGETFENRNQEGTFLLDSRTEEHPQKTLCLCFLNRHQIMKEIDDQSGSLKIF
jgi:hypothetical protein